jgi:uncharacterized protein (DUF2235 family)
MKRLAVFCDGTWNRADHVDKDGVAAPTNVVKLFNAVAPTDANGVEQLPHYEEGVGTGKLDHWIGGGLGVGLSSHVVKSYEWLIAKYQPGDELWFFGFSRGAFTARSLAGLVRNSGILRPENKDKVKQAYRLYRDPRKKSEPSEIAARTFRKENAWSEETEITFVGVWDTVGALGIPIGSGRIPLLSKLWAFHDTTLSSHVHNAYHAIAIDELRKPFKPTLWVKKDDEPEVAPNQNVEQVWFSGVHSDVGGGYSDSSLSEITLWWMATKARSCGLALKPDHLTVKPTGFDEKNRHIGIELAPNPDGEIHDSMSLMYKPLGPYHRRLRAHEGETVRGELASTAKTRHDNIEIYRPLGLSEWIAGSKPVQVIDVKQP